MGWIDTQFMALPVITLAVVRRNVGRDRFKFLVFWELIEKGGACPVNIMIMSRRA